VEREGPGEGLSIDRSVLADKPSPGPSREREGNARTCILSRDSGVRDGLVRLAISPDGAVLPDVRAKAPGRGSWIGVTRAELDVAQAKGKLKGALARAFKGEALTIPDDLGALIEAQLERQALDRLGLEAKAGHLVIGAERIESEARKGKLQLLLHASDARADGAGKLAQAWRVGSDREGTDLKGLALPVGRTTLSLALGRENVVHAGLTDAQAARRVRESLTRWLHFIGPDRVADACATPAQPSSAPDISADPERGSAQTGLE
jgi:predicted RNA-binding protein YlxR (DUF448 family)